MKNGLSSKVVVVAGRTSSRGAVLVVAFLVVTRETTGSLRDLWFLQLKRGVWRVIFLREQCCRERSGKMSLSSPLFFLWMVAAPLEIRVFPALPPSEQWPLLYMTHLLSAVLLCFLRVVEVCCAVERFWILSISNLWSPSQFSSFWEFLLQIPHMWKRIPDMPCFEKKFPDCPLFLMGSAYELTREWTKISSLNGSSLEVTSS